MMETTMILLGPPTSASSANRPTRPAGSFSGTGIEPAISGTSIKEEDEDSPPPGADKAHYGGKDKGRIGEDKEHECALIRIGMKDLRCTPPLRGGRRESRGSNEEDDDPSPQDISGS